LGGDIIPDSRATSLGIITPSHRLRIGETRRPNTLAFDWNKEPDLLAMRRR
jgi:hypothetical protein